MPDSIPVIVTINEKFEELSRMQRKIADFVRKNSSQVIRMSISELAEATGNKSESSVVRFYRTLGFKGYHDFKVALATQIAGKSFYHTYTELDSNDSIGDIKSKIYNGIIKTLHDNFSLLKTEDFEKAVELIFNAKRIFFLGYGQSGYLCENAQFKFMRLGYNCFFNHDSHFNSILLSSPQEGDIIFCISFSGLSKDVVIPIKNCKPPAKIIALTGSAKSPIEKIADVCLTSFTEELNYRTDAMIARHVQLMIIDILYISVAIKSGDSLYSRLERSKQSLSHLKL